jgi:rod shape-determining protein MreD
VRALATCALALLLLAVESVLVQSVGLQVTRIDVTVVLVVFLGLRASLVEGAFTAFAVGYLLDVFTGRPTGLYPFLAVLVFLLARLGASLIDARARALFALACAGGTLVHGLLATFFTWLTARAAGAPGAQLSGLPLQVLLTALAGALLWPLLRKLIDPNLDRQPTGVLL